MQIIFILYEHDYYFFFLLIYNCYRCCLVQKVPYLIRNPTPLDLESSHQSTWNTTRLGLNIGGPKLTQCWVSFGNPHTQHISRRAHRGPVSVKESSSVESENNYAAEEPVAKTLSVDEAM